MIPRRLAKSLAYSAAVLAVTGGLLALMGSLAKKPEPARVEEKAYLVSAVTVTVGDIRPRLPVFGTVEAREHVDLTSPVEAEVLGIPRLEGERVAAGESLVRLDLRDLRLRREETVAAIEEIAAQIDGIRADNAIEEQRLEDTGSLLELAQRQFERSERLLAQKVIPQSEFEVAQANLEQRKIEHLAQRQKLQNLATQERRLGAQRRRTRSQLGQTDLLLEQALIPAPFPGIVLDVPVSPGRRVRVGEPLIEVFNPESLVVRASIPNRHMHRLSSASPVAIVRRPGGDALTLSVDHLKPEIEEGQGSAEAVVRVPGGGWILGSVVSLEILLDPVAGVVALPYDALYSDNRVFRVGGDRRAEGIDCELVGLADVPGDAASALLRCAALGSGDLVVSQKIPNLATGFKLEVLD